MTSILASARPVYHRRRSCRTCGAEHLEVLLSLGPQPLANAFLRSEAEFAAEARYPLELCWCDGCSLVQLADVVDPEVLFRDYIYVTGTSETMAQHNRKYAQAVAEALGLRPDDLVVEVASNDGSLLQCFRQQGVRTLGIEPAVNIAELARARGLETLTDFFDAGAGRRIRESHGPARVVVGNNVLAHVDDPVGFLHGAADLLCDDGRVILEVPYAGDMLDLLEYDTVYHEHLCYFSLRALLRLCEAAGLRALRADRVPVHGGSVRLYAGLASRHPEHAGELTAWAAAETRDGVGSRARWERFARDVAGHRQALRALLLRLRDEGSSVAAYGAPAKGNTLLNYCEIDRSLVGWTVDRNSLKVGTWTPGAHLPVYPVEELLARQPDYALILAWNFAEEVMRQQQAYRSRGGRFILPIPAPRIV